MQPTRERQHAACGAPALWAQRLLLETAAVVRGAQERDYEQAVEAYTQALDTLAKGSGACGVAAVRSSRLTCLHRHLHACGMQHGMRLAKQQRRHVACKLQSDRELCLS